MTIIVDRRCDDCQHPQGKHPYDLDNDRGGRQRCTEPGCTCRGYRFDHTAAVERRCMALIERVQRQRRELRALNKAVHFYILMWRDAYTGLQNVRDRPVQYAPCRCWWCRLKRWRRA